jgi:hypothetical protein
MASRHDGPAPPAPNDLAQLDDINSVLDDKNFVVVDPGLDQVHLLTEIEELKQQLAIAQSVIEKSNISESQASRLVAQSHLSVTQLVDDNSLLESQVKVLRDKLQATQVGGLGELKAVFEAEKHELSTRYTFEVEDLQMNCKQLAQNAQENSSRYNAEASKVEQLSATTRELRKQAAAQADIIQALEAQNKRHELRIATDAEDVALGRTLSDSFHRQIEELHSSIEAMYATASASSDSSADGDEVAAAAASQAKLIAKQLSEALAKLADAALEKEQSARDKRQAEVTRAALQEEVAAEAAAKSE